MLLWRIKSSSSEGEHVECHLVRRDTEYRLSLRAGKAVIIQEVHRSPVAAAERAENLRRQAVAGAFVGEATETDTDDLSAHELRARRIAASPSPRRTLRRRAPSPR